MALASTVTPRSSPGASVSNFFEETIMQWTPPAYTDLRFGFEVTMYIATR
ncbi:coenzyme PQQ precursor peptide PqqA [Trinickia symbiotica]|nr:coenzyme PQQ precursor peptide PqqA [Trinickia symbiotica]